MFMNEVRECVRHECQRDLSCGTSAIETSDVCKDSR